MGQVESTRKEDVVERINLHSRNYLGPNLAFSAIFGSYAYNGLSKNDIDLIFVTKEKISPKERGEMKKAYFDLHAKYDLTPDHKFPGEYVSLEGLRKAQEGAGFLYSEGVEIPLLACGDDWNDFNDYRHHLTAVGGPTIFLDGSVQEYINNKKRCLKTLAGVTLLHQKKVVFSLEELVSDIVGAGKDFLGFADTPRVKSYLDAHLNELLHQLVLMDEIESKGENIFLFKGNFLENLEGSIREYNKK